MIYCARHDGSRVLVSVWLAAVLTLSVCATDFSPTPIDEGYKALDIDLMSRDDVEALRRALEELPCCTTNKDGSKKGEFIGGERLIDHRPQ